MGQAVVQEGAQLQVLEAGLHAGLLQDADS